MHSTFHIVLRDKYYADGVLNINFGKILDTHDVAMI